VCDDRCRHSISSLTLLFFCPEFSEFETILAPFTNILLIIQGGEKVQLNGKSFCEYIMLPPLVYLPTVQHEKEIEEEEGV
jgi:hypothetical protein